MPSSERIDNIRRVGASLPAIPSLRASRTIARGPASDPASQLPGSQCRTGRVVAGLRRLSAEVHGSSSRRREPVVPSWGEDPGRLWDGSDDLSSDGQASLASHGCRLDDNVHNYSSVLFKPAHMIVGRCANDVANCVRPYLIFKYQFTFLYPSAPLRGAGEWR